MSVLYHASQNKHLEIIEPKCTLSKDKYIGDFVFATRDKNLATMYLVTKGLANIMNTKGDLWIAICAKRDDYLKNDIGGAIYDLPIDSFIKSPQTELDEYEMVSRVAIKPIKRIVYNKSIDAILDIGATVYFVDELMFSKLVSVKNKLKILSTLKPYEK